MALAEIIFPTSIKNVVTREYFVYTLGFFKNSPSTVNTSSGGATMDREDWSNFAYLLDGENKTLTDVVTRLQKPRSPLLLQAVKKTV